MASSANLPGITLEVFFQLIMFLAVEYREPIRTVGYASAAVVIGWAPSEDAGTPEVFYRN